MQYCEALKQERAKLCEQLAKYEEEVSFLNDRLDALDTNNEFLKMAKYLSFNPAEKEKAKKRISKLVREVDKCIALLNE